MPILCKVCKAKPCSGRNRICDDCRQLCSKCRDAPRSRDHAYCLDCNATKKRDNRQVNPPTREQRRRYSAASYVAVYLSRGKIERLPCQIDDCNAEPTYAYQPNLSKPLEILWCCRKHLRGLRKRDV